MVSDLSKGQVRVRRARSLVVTFSAKGVTAYNFMTHSDVLIDQLDISILAAADSWTSINELLGRMGCSGDLLLKQRVNRLVSATQLTLYGTKAARDDEDYERNWVWGGEAGAFHFGMKDAHYLDPTSTAAWIQDRLISAEPTPLYITNHHLEKTIDLPDPDASEEPMSSLLRRRSWRGFDDAQNALINLDDLSACLFAGLGITGFIQPDIPGHGPLPIKPTPSGGARNPYEAFIFARKVQGVPFGIYHYSAVENNLGLMSRQVDHSIGQFLAEQPWFDNAAVLIFLVAHFERTMWKYPHPTGLRVVLLEAGHIAQNILLVAAARGLCATPTCAVSDALCERALNLNPVTQSVLYTVSIGRLGKNGTIADPACINPNPQFPGIHKKYENL